MSHKLACLTLGMIVALHLIAIGCKDRNLPLVDKTKIAYVAKLKDGGFHDAIFKGIREESIKVGVDVDVFYARDQQDLNGQRQFLTEILQSKKYKGVMLAPNDSVALIGDVGELDAADIPFVLIDTPLADSIETRNFTNDCGFVGTNNLLVGKLAAEFIANQVDGGNIVLMRGNHQHQSSVDREAGFVGEVKRHSNLHIIHRLTGWWEIEDAFFVYSNFMKANRKSVRAVFAYNDPMAVGVSRYYDMHPEKQRPVIIGVDGVLLGQRAVLEQKISASVVQSPEVMGKVGLQQIFNCLNKKVSKKEQTLTPVTLLNASLTLGTMGVQ